MMQQFPFLYFEKLYRSPLSQTEVLHRVQGTVVESVSAWQEMWSRRPKEPYYGRVDAYNGVFDIMRSTNRRNDFFPAVEGFTEECPPAGGGSFVRLRMKLPERTKYLAIVYFSFVGAFCIACIAALLYGSASWVALMPFGMFGAAQLSFWLEVWSIERRYLNLLELVEISETP